MPDLNYRIQGVNTDQISKELGTLRRHSSSFRALEDAAIAKGYKNIQINMGAYGPEIADSGEVDPSTWGIRLRSDASGSWGVGGRQATVGEVIAHELAHAVVPPQYQQREKMDFSESGIEGKWVRRQAGDVARDLGLPGSNNADHLITKIPINKNQGCTVQNPRGDTPEDGVLFLDGSRGFSGLSSFDSPVSSPGLPTGSYKLATEKPVNGSGRYLRRVDDQAPVSPFVLGAQPTPFTSRDYSSPALPPGDSFGSSVDKPMPSWLPSSVWGLSDKSVSSGSNHDVAAALVGMPRSVNRPTMSAPDVNASSANPASSANTNSSLNIADWIASLAGVKPANPMQSASATQSDDSQQNTNSTISLPWWLKNIAK